MKALCITGANNAVLKNIASPFYNAGMQVPKGLEREQHIDFSRWHHKTSNAFKAGKPLGKIWENLATDLVLANLDSDCWGWYEENSIDALNFWAELEPNIHFFLVCTRPDIELQQKVTEASTSLNAEQWLQEWYERHRKMLDFYLNHAERCLLIDATDALEHINGQLQLAHQQWQLPLNTNTLATTGEHDPHHNVAVESSGNTDKNNQIAGWIARELIKNSPYNIADFYAELQAAQYPFTEGHANTLIDWLNAELDSSELQSLLHDYQALHKQATNKEQLLALQNAKSSTEQTLEQARQENELLLLQLHQVQEELESTFLNKQKLEQEATKSSQQQQELQKQLKAVETNGQQQRSQANSFKAQLEESKQENELLLLQLHQVQEELESTFLNKQKLEQAAQEAGQQQQELQKKLSLVQASKQNYKSRIQDLEKQLEQAKQQSSNTQELEEARQENELLLLQLHQVQEELEHYFLQHQQVNQKQEQLAADNRRLKQQLRQAEQQAAQPVSLISKLAKKQKARPRLDYGQLQLQNEQVNPDYEHLWIKLKNPTFGNQIADEWSFRLSCAGVRPGDFGKQPKLELPEQPDQLLQQWFAESECDHGRKLELRFALPNAMDGSVWKQLHGQDKQLVRSLVEQLPAMLNELQEQGRRLSRSWDDWHKLSVNMQRILASKKDKK